MCHCPYMSGTAEVSLEISQELALSGLKDSQDNSVSWPDGKICFHKMEQSRPAPYNRSVLVQCANTESVPLNNSLMKPAEAENAKTYGVIKVPPGHVGENVVLQSDVKTYRSYVSDAVVPLGLSVSHWVDVKRQQFKHNGLGLLGQEVIAIAIQRKAPVGNIEVDTITAVPNKGLKNSL